MIETRKEIQVKVNFATANRLKAPITNLHSVSGIMLQFVHHSFLNDFGFRSYVTAHTDVFKIPVVSYARHLRDF
jgi:hypothetical protein